MALDWGRRIEEVTQTQPIPVHLTPVDPDPDPPGRLRPNRSFALVAVALAVVVAGAIWRVISSDGAVPVSNPSRVYSPSGHRPNQPSTEPVVTIAWTTVKGAAGYWWAVVADPSNLPAPKIIASADDGMVSFELTGRRYFVLRTAVESGRGNDYRWSDALVYGPLIVEGRAAPGTTDVTPPEAGATGSSRSVTPGGRAYQQGSTGTGGSPGGTAGGGSSSGRSAPSRPPGDPGTPGQGTGQPGSPGSPGEPGDRPGGGQQCTGGECPGTPGEPGPDGGPGSVPP